MKNIFNLNTLLFCFIIMSITVTNAQTWVLQTFGSTQTFRGVAFSDINKGTIVGTSGTIFNTTDAGNTWNQQSSGITVQLNDVNFVNDSTGISVGNTGTILRTTNGGDTWTSITSGVTNSFTSISFVNEMIGTIVGSGGIVRRTTDGGLTWFAQSSGVTGPLDGVSFINDSVGLASGLLGIIRTTDAGETWTSQLSGVGRLYSVHFVDESFAYAVGVNGRIVKSSDGGSTWELLTSGVTNQLNGVFFADPLTGTAVGNLIILRTTNGGLNWFVEPGGEGRVLNKSFFNNQNVGTAVGTNGIILRRTLIPRAPSNLIATPDIFSVYLTWNDNAEFEDGFIIERKDGDSASVNPFVMIDTVGANINEFTDSELSANTTYTYRIFAYNDEGESDYSNFAEVTTLRLPPLLFFKSDYHLRLDNETWIDTLQLLYHGEPLNSLSFKLRANPPDLNSDNVLVLTGVEKGSDIGGSEWNFFYEQKGAGDSTYFIVLIYGQDSTTLPAGNYEDLVRFTYDIVDISGSDTLRSYFRLDKVESSLINGDPGGVTADDDQVIDVVNQLVLFYGDINMDGFVDIADLIMIREYILERITFSGEEFVRGDLAPWIVGNPAPSPDGKVNIQDLSLLQNIILTGQYPSGEPSAKSLMNLFVNTSVKKTGSSTTVSIYISNEGIRISTNSDERIIGMQLELFGLEHITQNMYINAELGTAFFKYSNLLLRTLYYDPAGKIELSEGKNLIAYIPVEISNPGTIEIYNLVLINNCLQKIDNINVEIVIEEEESLPKEYSLSQNYPNPFNPTTTIEFALPQSGDVIIKIYNMLGQEVRTLYSGQMERGSYRIIWDGLNDTGSKIGSGTYIYRMVSGNHTESKKMILLK